MDMDFHQALEYAHNASEIHRSRKHLLYTFGSTRLPYICLSDAPHDKAKVLVREGELRAEKPQIAVPGGSFSFSGFDLEENAGDDFIRILLARRIEIPTGKYTNTAGGSHLEVGPLEAVVDRTLNALEKENDIRTAVLSAPDDVWNLSLLVYVTAQMARSAQANISEHFERLHNQGGAGLL